MLVFESNTCDLFASKVLHHNPPLPGLLDHALLPGNMIEMITT